MRKNVAALVAALVAIAAALIGTIGVSYAATGTPKRSDSSNEAVLFVHGFEAGGWSNCGNYWGSSLSEFRKWGWTGPLKTVGFYAGDKNCDVVLKKKGATTSANTQNTSIKELGRQLANHIYASYTSKGKSVDVVAHSMGGLIIRAALTGVKKKEAGFPAKLYVEDVVTLSAPHNGSSWFTRVGGLKWDQVKEMSGSSSLMKWLLPNPQSAQGTDWTVVGSDDDSVVDAGSATTMAGAGHKVVYLDGSDVGHGNMSDTVRGTYRQKYWNAGGTWHTTAAGAAPLKVASTACYFWKKW